MAYCVRCGMSFKDRARACPLCGGKPTAEKGASAEAGALDFPEEKPFLEEVLDEQDISHQQRRYIFFEIVSIIFGSALFITLLTDVLISHAITWSRYSSPAIVGGFLALGMPAILKRRPWILFAVLAPSLVLMLFLLDVMNGRIGWFLFWGLPLSVWAIVCAAGAGGIILAMRKRGLNVIAVILLFCALFCVGLEITIALNLSLHPMLVWSPIVALSAMPAAGMLFYLHYRIVRQASLKKLFRV